MQRQQVIAGKIRNSCARAWRSGRNFRRGRVAFLDVLAMASVTWRTADTSEDDASQDLITQNSDASRSKRWLIRGGVSLTMIPILPRTIN